MTDNEDRDDGANRDDHPAATLRWQLDDVLAQFEAQLTTGGDLLDDMRSSEPGTSLETFSAASSYWHERNLAFLGGAFGRAIGERYDQVQVPDPVEPLTSIAVRMPGVPDGYSIASWRRLRQLTAARVGHLQTLMEQVVAPRTSDARVRRSVSYSEWDKTPRNAPCPCGSGKKYRQCHGVE